MNSYTSLQDIMLILFGMAVFVIVLVTVYRSLQKTMFQGKTAILMALAVSALCIVGMYHFLVTPGDLSSGPETGNETNVTLNYILLPYVTLAVAILLSQLLLFASKILPSKGSEKISKETEPKLTKPKFHGSRKKEKAEAPLPAPKSRARRKNEAKTSAVGQTVSEAQSAS